MAHSDAEIGAALKQLREKAGIRTATEAAAASGLEAGKLSKAESGTTSLTVAELSRVLDLYEASFLTFHLTLQGGLGREAAQFMGAVAAVLDEVSGQ